MTQHPVLRPLATFGILLLALATFVTTATLATRGGGSADGPGNSEFVTAYNGEFWLNGEPFYYAGTNNYELMYQGQPTVTNFFAAAQAEDYSVIRAWAFFDIGTLDGDLGVEISNKGTYFQYWDPEAGKPAYNDGPDGLEQLDWVVYQAKLHDIKMVFPLVNNWTAFGGVDQYVRWADGQWHDDFFTDPEIKQWYKDWVTHLLERENIYTGVKYKDEPAIMMWEVGNELRCSESGPYLSAAGCSNTNIVDWTREMSDHVRSIDENHLIGFGGEGFLCTEPGGASTLFNCAESGDPVKIVALPNIDVNGIHVYPNHWEPEEPTDDWEDWGVWWIQQHGQIAADANKPFFIGEYGWVDDHTRVPAFQSWLKAFYDAGGDGSHFWIMQPSSSIAQDPDGVGFTENCPSAVCTLVGNYTRHYGYGIDWNEFAPVAAGDFTTTRAGVPTTFSVTGNDLAFGDATLDLSTIDLDPATPGRQTEWIAERGLFTVDDSGNITFVPADGVETGAARGSYVIYDSMGRLSPEAKFSATILRADQVATEPAE